jgi:hypothetical protein
MSYQLLSRSCLPLQQPLDDNFESVREFISEGVIPGFDFTITAHMTSTAIETLFVEEANIFVTPVQADVPELPRQGLNWSFMRLSGSRVGLAAASRNPLGR